MGSNHNIRAALALLQALVLGACTAAEPPSRDADEAAIRALFQRNAEAANRRDAEGVVATYWPDGDVWIAGRPRVSGLDAIGQNELDWFATPGYRGWEGRVEEIRFLGSDAALVEITGTTLLNDGEIAEQTTIVVSRRDREWRISAALVMVLDERRSGSPVAGPNP